MNGSIGRLVLEDSGVRVAVLSLGGTVQDWRVPLAGREVPVVLGLSDPEGYRQHRAFLGAIVGRVANRIAGARYVQGGKQVVLKANDGRHQLHGGPDGLWAVNFDLERDGPSRLRLHHVSPPGAGGFPGRVAFSIDMTLRAGRLTWDMRATPDEQTPISLAQHNYYALTSELADHCLTLASTRRLERDAEGIMSGGVLADSSLQAGRALLTTPDALLDDFFLFDPVRDPACPVADVRATNGLRLRMWSDQPGAQVYTGQWLPEAAGGHAARPLRRCAGFCIEPSGLPNALNIGHFPSILCSPDQPYRQILSVEIASAPADND